MQILKHHGHVERELAAVVECQEQLVAVGGGGAWADPALEGSIADLARIRRDRRSLSRPSASTRPQPGLPMDLPRQDQQ
jgi:hypothetical protein